MQVKGGHEAMVSCLQIFGTNAFSGSWDRTIRHWDLETGECKKVLHGHADILRTLCLWWPFLISGGDDGTIMYTAHTIFDIALSLCVDILFFFFLKSVSLFYIHLGIIHLFSVWHAQTGRKLQTIETKQRSVWGIARRGTRVVSVGGHVLSVWILDERL
jgi:WD40 repeat protein